MRRLDVWVKKINIVRIIDHYLRLLSFLKLCEVLNELYFCSTTDLSVLSRFWVVFPRTETIRSHRSRAGNPSNLSPASKEMISDSVELCETEVCFLHIQLIGTHVWLPKNPQCSIRSRFWVLKISRKIGVLKQSQPALFGSITHMTILFIFTCVMDVRYQPIQSFVTDVDPFRYRSCKFVHWPESSNTCQVQAFQKQFERILLTILLQISILPLWNDGHRCMEYILCRVVESSCLPTHNIVPHISWHDLPHRRTTKKYEYFPSMVVFQFPRAEIRDSNMVL